MGVQTRREGPTRDSWLWIEFRKRLFREELIMSEAEKKEGAGPTPDDLKRAFKAFKKRLKLTRLDNESRLSGGILSGRASNIVAISPPNDFPPAVWEELVRQGKLKKMSGGTYGLAEE
jgi:hypothetical protein